MSERECLACGVPIEGGVPWDTHGPNVAAHRHQGGCITALRTALAAEREKREEAEGDLTAANEHNAHLQASQACAWSRYRAVKAAARALVEFVQRRADSPGGKCVICNVVSVRDDGTRAHAADCLAMALAAAVDAREEISASQVDEWRRKASELPGLLATLDEIRAELEAEKVRAVRAKSEADFWRNWGDSD